MHWDPDDPDQETWDLSSATTSNTAFTTRSMNYMPSDAPREILVDFNGTQFMQNVDQMSRNTIIHVNLFLQYLKDLEPQRRWVRSKVIGLLKRNYQHLRTHYQDSPVRVYGPVRVPVMLDGVHFKIAAGVTLNDKLSD